MLVPGHAQQCASHYGIPWGQLVMVVSPVRPRCSPLVLCTAEVRGRVPQHISLLWCPLLGIHRLSENWRPNKQHSIALSVWGPVVVQRHSAHLESFKSALLKVASSSVAGLKQQNLARMKIAQANNMKILFS